MKVTDHKTLWDYFYNQEVRAFHTCRNRGHHHQHFTLLGDKYAFEEMLEQQGIQAAGITINATSKYIRLSFTTKKHGARIWRIIL